MGYTQRRVRILYILIGILFFSLAESAMGQFRGYYSPRDSVWVFSMDSVFVEETQPPQLSPMSVSSVSEERIHAMGYRDLNEIITGEVAGIISTEKGVMGYGVADGSAGHLSVRGVGGNPTTGVLIAQNGKPEIMGLMGHPVPDAYSADFIRDVEVIKGPASVIYGTNALGGVINMKTKRLYKQGMETRIRLATGNYDVRRGGIQHGAKVNDFDYFLVFGRRATTGHRPHSAFRSSSYHVHAGYELRPNMYFSVTGKSVPFHAEDPGPLQGERGEEFDITRSDVTVSGRMDFEPVSLDYQVYLNRGEHEISDGFHSRDFARGATLKHHFTPFRNNSTTFGLDYKDYGGKIYRVNLPPMWENPSGNRYSVSETGLYVLTEQQIAHRWKPSFGFRLNSHSIFGQVSVPHLGLSYDLTDALTLYSSYGKGFRSPTIREMYLFPAPNPDLQPEVSYSIQAGVRYQAGSRLKAQASLYRLGGENLIEQHGTFPNFEYRNSGEFRHFGVESSVKFIPARGLHVSANYSWFHPDRPVARQPAHDLLVSGTYHWKYLSLRYKLHYVTGLKDFAAGAYQALPSYTVSELGADIVFQGWGTLFFNVKNLFDTEYQTMHGYPMPGITYEGGVLIDF
ncbi:MAG TPA: TonB-dependent receptor [bacterium]|nr:TonB-dependent receptor [bacterium]